MLNYLEVFASETEYFLNTRALIAPDRILPRLGHFWTLTYLGAVKRIRVGGATYHYAERRRVPFCLDLLKWSEHNPEQTQEIMNDRIILDRQLDRDTPEY